MRYEDWKNPRTGARVLYDETPGRIYYLVIKKTNKKQKAVGVSYTDDIFRRIYCIADYSDKVNQGIDLGEWGPVYALENRCVNKLPRIPPWVRKEISLFLNYE